jgi:nitronate monooxygenase
VKAQAIGCDAVSVDGFECAGHPGEDDVPGLILLPFTRDQVTIPIVASGGFGDARGLVAALALGADGINMGTRFLATAEAPIHENVKRKLVEGDERTTALLFRTLRNTARVFKNSIADQVVAIEEKPGPTDFAELAPLVAGTRGKKVIDEGDMEHGIWSAGQVMGLIHDIPTVQVLVDRIVAEAEAIIRGRLTSLVAT